MSESNPPPERSATGPSEKTSPRGVPLGVFAPATVFNPLVGLGMAAVLFRNFGF